MSKGDLYLKITGMKTGKFTGESQDDSHKGEIELDSWSWSMDAPVDGRSGQRTGRSVLHGVNLTKHADSSTPALMSAMNNNEILTVALYVRKTSGKKPIDYLIVKLTNAVISSYEIAWQETPTPRPVERLQMRFARIDVSYSGQDSSGSATGSSSFTADAFSPQV